MYIVHSIVQSHGGFYIPLPKISIYFQYSILVQGKFSKILMRSLQKRSLLTMTILTITNKFQNKFIECRNRHGTTVLFVCKSRPPHQMDAHIWGHIVQMFCFRARYRGVQVNSQIGKVKNVANCFQSGKFIFIANVFLKWHQSIQQIYGRRVSQ